MCETAVQECNAEQEDNSTKIFNIIDAFSVPRYTYVKERKKFIADSTLEKSVPKLHGSPADKANLFRERYSILHQRSLRHKLFTPPSLGSNPAEMKKVQLKPLEFLVGSTTKMKDVIVLGMLVQLKEGKWYLEDPTGSIQLDLSSAFFQPGLFTENSFVLAEGWYEDSVFHIDGFGLPPPECAAITRNYFGNINFFGGPSAVQVKSSEKLAKIEKQNEDAMFVILSDVWLDNPRVMEKLNQLFLGYKDFPPTAFIICGNFLSAAKVLSHAKTLEECFKELGNMLSADALKDLVQKSRFIFVPGPNDPGHATILPRPAIPNCLTETFRKKIPSAEFTSNPCRIQYCTQEIVICREDLVTKMCRNCVKFPTDGNVPNHFTKSIISQAHLCPLPIHVSPIYWSHDAALRLYPLPDVIVTADKYDPFTMNYCQSTVFNPGSFLRSDFSFKVYYPATQEVQDSQVRDEVNTTVQQSLDVSNSESQDQSQSEMDISITLPPPPAPTAGTLNSYFSKAAKSDQAT